MKPAGRSSSSTSPMTSSCGQASANSVSGGWEEISVTTRPIKVGIIMSSTAMTPPPRNKAAVGPLA